MYIVSFMFYLHSELLFSTCLFLLSQYHTLLLGFYRSKPCEVLGNYDRFDVLLQYQLTNIDNTYLIHKQVILASYRIMEKNHTEKKMEQLLKDEKEKLLSEIQNRVEKKKSLIKNDEEVSYRKHRF